MSEFVTLGDHIFVQKGKAPLATGYAGPGAEPYLNPDYLRGRACAEVVKAGPDAARAVDGDTILLWDGSNAGEFFRAKSGVVASTMAKISPSKAFRSAYFFHVAKQAEIYLKSQTNGTGIPHVDGELLAAIQAFCPTPTEQRVIAEILDTLDTAIHEIQAIIAKLKAVKQGLLHDLLTRGIDANGDLRPPQAEAPHLYKQSPLGFIPKEWMLKTGSDVCEEIVVGIVIRPTQYYRPEGIPVLRSANVRENRLSLSDLVFMSERDHRSLSKSAVRPGDVLTVRTGYPGTSCVVDSSLREANCVDILISRPSIGLDANFWSLWINSHRGKSQVLAAQGGLAQQHFNVGDLQKLVVSMPALSEQTEIARRLAAGEVRIDAEHRTLVTLADLKRGLMHDLLTGRVRVTPLLAEAERQMECA